MGSNVSPIYPFFLHHSRYLSSIIRYISTHNIFENTKKKALVLYVRIDNSYFHTPMASFLADCRKEKWANSFVLTFLMAIFWISIYSYMMVWMITVVGATFMIPDTVMGLTFIAAGVSVPDALAGIAVVREGI